MAIMVAAAQAQPRVLAEPAPAVFLKEFAESGINPQIARALADEIGVQVAGVLWADSLGPKNSGAATYIEMMRTDTRELIAGLRRG